MVRRLFLNIKRFSGKEMKKSSSIDAIIALIIIVFLMISLLTMNIGYIGIQPGLCAERVAMFYAGANFPWLFSKVFSNFYFCLSLPDKELKKEKWILENLQ